MRLMSSTRWEGMFTTIRNLFHTFMLYILKSAYLYRGDFFFNKYFLHHLILGSKKELCEKREISRRFNKKLFRILLFPVFTELKFSIRNHVMILNSSDIFVHKNLYLWIYFCSDFPGLCFASTRCATVEPGEIWELSPYCGRSTCVKSDAEQKGAFHLFELVEDCGPLPKPNPKCKLSETKFNRTAAFPDCCPVFECEAGAKLEYPEIPEVKPEQGTPTTAKPKA